MTDLTLVNVLYVPFCTTVHGHLGSRTCLGVIFTVYLSSRVMCYCVCVVSWRNSMTSFDEYMSPTQITCVQK